MLYNSAGESLSEILRSSEHGQYLLSHGFVEDVMYCSEIDRLNVVPILKNGEIIKKE